MKTVYKYPLNVEHPVIKMPLGAEILAVREQGDEICVWAKVDTAQTASALRAFNVYGTGHPITDSPSAEYLGTAMLMGGRLVLHVFEQHP